MVIKKTRDLSETFSLETEDMLLDMGINPEEIYGWRIKHHESAQKEELIKRRYLATQNKHLMFCMEFAKVIQEFKELLITNKKCNEKTFYDEYFWISRRTFYRYSQVLDYWDDIKEYNPTSVNHALNLIKQQGVTELDMESKSAQNKRRIADTLTIKNLVEQVADLKAELEEFRTLANEQGEQMKVLIAELSMYRSLEKSKPSLE